MTVLHTDMFLNDLVCVCVEDSHNCNRLHCRNKSLSDREGTNRRGNVSTVCLFVNVRDHNIHLTEGIIDICVLSLRRRNDRDLTCGGNSSSHTVDLLDIRASHNL